MYSTLIIITTCFDQTLWPSSGSPQTHKESVTEEEASPLQTGYGVGSFLFRENILSLPKL